MRTGDARETRHGGRVSRNRPEQQPGIATAEQGWVLLDGPNGVAVALTPDAAILTGHSLIAAGELARGQNRDDPPPGGDGA